MARKSLIDLIKLTNSSYDWVMKPRNAEAGEDGDAPLGGYTPNDLKTPKNLMNKKLNKDVLKSYVASFNPDIENPEESEDIIKKRTRYMNLAKRARESGGING